MGRRGRSVPGRGVWPGQATVLRVQISEPESTEVKPVIHGPSHNNGFPLGGKSFLPNSKHLFSPVGLLTGAIALMRGGAQIRCGWRCPVQHTVA